jgi:hypothetical protein
MCYFLHRLRPFFIFRGSPKKPAAECHFEGVTLLDSPLCSKKNDRDHIECQTVPFLAEEEEVINSDNKE